MLLQLGKKILEKEVGNYLGQNCINHQNYLNFSYKCFVSGLTLIPFIKLKSKQFSQLIFSISRLKVAKIFSLVSGIMQLSKKATIFIPLDK